VHFCGQGFDPLAQFVGELGQTGVLGHQVHELRGLAGGQGLPFHAGICEVLAMGGIGFGMGFVAIRLPGLGKEDERGGIGGLKTEGEVEEDEGVLIEAPPGGDGEDVHDDPYGDD
jgi:hypothetical protein